MTSAENLIPTLDARTASRICQYLPVPAATGEIEADIRSDVEMVRQREDSHSGCRTDGENEPSKAVARRPSQNCKRKKQRKCRREDVNLEKSHQGAHCHSGHNPDTPTFARPLYDKCQRCSGDRNTIETSRSNVLEPEITVKGVGDIQQSGVRYQECS